jgi:hypothetical protein
MRLILAFAILCASACSGLATLQNVLSVAIETNGWIAKVTIASMATNGTYSYGLGTSNKISGSEKLVINFFSPGYDSTGTSNLVARTVYGTKRVRFPYPGEAFAKQDVSGSDVVCHIALSDYIYSGDSTITANIAEGLYIQGSNTNASTNAISVSNSSTMPYPKVIGNWTWPGKQRWTNSTEHLRWFGSQAYGRNGRPLACVKFITTDEHSVAITNTVTDMSIDSTLPDRLRTGEYVSSVSQSSFTQGDQIRCDIIAYPHVGDSTAVLDTTLNTYSGHTTYPRSITNLCDKAATYSLAIAVVDALGSDILGRATNCAPGDVNALHYFASVAKAANQIQATNNTYHGHNDVGAGIIYVRSGITTWLGASSTYGSTPKCYIKILPYPGDSVTFSALSGDKNIADCMHIQGVSFTGTANPFSSTDFLWLDQCTISNTASALATSSPSIWITHSTIPTATLVPNGNENTSYMLRGNYLSNYNNAIHPHLFMGNVHPDTNGQDITLIMDAAGMTRPGPDYTIWYNNLFMGARKGASSAIQMNHNIGTTNGAIVANNVFELCITNDAAHFSMVGANTAGVYVTNLLSINNVFVGNRVTSWYNSSGSTPLWRYLCFVKNTVYDVGGIKSDTFGTPNGARVGNWPLLWNVGCSGVVYAELGGQSPGGLGFLPEFSGLSGCMPQDWGGTTNVWQWQGYATNNTANMQTGPHLPPGGGTYRTSSTSPFKLMQHDWILPFDVEGNARGRSSPVGAYASGNVRKGTHSF